MVYIIVLFTQENLEVGKYSKTIEEETIRLKIYIKTNNILCQKNDYSIIPEFLYTIRRKFSFRWLEQGGSIPCEYFMPRTDHPTGVPVTGENRSNLFLNGFRNTREFEDT